MKLNLVEVAILNKKLYCLHQNTSMSTPSPHPPNTKHKTCALNPHSPYPPKSHGNNFEVKVKSPKTSSCELHFEATKSERRTLLLRK
jgi:hypothetical protein